jgi:hypothetical protein
MHLHENSDESTREVGPAFPICGKKAPGSRIYTRMCAMRRYQLGLLIALSLGMTGCQSSGSSWNPSTWSWNPWASKDTAVAKNDAKSPALPSAEVTKESTSTAVASRNTPAATPSYPTTGAPAVNFGVPQQGAYAAAQQNAGNPIQPMYGQTTGQPAPAYGAQPAYGTAPAGGYPNTTVPAGYMNNGHGNYGQPASAPAAPTGYGTSPTSYGATAPAYGVSPTNTTPSAYGQQPYPGTNPYAQPPAQPGATPGYGQGASYDTNNPSSAFASGNFQQAAAAAPARNTAPFMPGSIKPMNAGNAAATSSVLQAGFEAKPNEAMAAATPAYGTAPAGMTCENGICYPNGNTTTAVPAGYQQPAAIPSTNYSAPATNSSSPSFYR